MPHASYEEFAEARQKGKQSTHAAVLTLGTLGLLGTDTTEGKQTVRLILRDDPHGVDDAWDEAENGEQDVDPEVLADAHLQEDPQGREQYRDYDAEHVHRYLPSIRLTFLPTTLPDPGGCKH